MKIKKNIDAIIWGLYHEKFILKINPDRIDGLADSCTPSLSHIYRFTTAFQNTWTIFLLCLSTVTLLFVTLSTRSDLCHKLQRWLVRMPLCKRLHRRILWKRWKVWHGIKYYNNINFLLNLAARKCSKIAGENI